MQDEIEEALAYHKDIQVIASMINQHELFLDKFSVYNWMLHDRERRKIYQANVNKINKMVYELPEKLEIWAKELKVFS